jgi:thiol-disulfide isomerase/thioredoxin
MMIFRNTAAFCASVALSLAAAGCGGGGGAAATGPGASDGASQGGLVGSAAPDFTAESVTGEGPTSVKEANGKVVILDFWATYCAPCKKSFPKYQEMVDQFGGELAVIAISVDDPEEAKKEQLEEFVKETGVKFAIVWDKDKSAAQKYIDKGGVVRHIHAGYESGEEAKIAEEVNALLGK